MHAGLGRQAASANELLGKTGDDRNKRVTYGAGTWQFEVQAQDAAGNVAPDSLPAAWIMALQPGEPYALVETGPFGPTANTTAAFALQVTSGLTNVLCHHGEAAHNAHVEHVGAVRAGSAGGRGRAGR